MKTECPQCGAHTPAVKIIGSSAFCTCGWFGPVNHRELKVRLRRKKTISGILVALSLAVTGFVLYEYKTWGSYMGNHVVIRAKTILGLATPEDWQELGIMCATMGDYRCSENAFAHVVAASPSNEYALLQLGYAQTKLGKHPSAVKSFEQLFKHGAAGYISAAAYAESMAALGHTDEAKTWYYRSIRMEPRAVGTVDHLIDLLVKKESYAEALSLIGTVEALVPSAEKYFAGRAVALGDLLEKQRPAGGRTMTIQLASIHGLHFLPVRFEEMNSPALFMVDSGAMTLVLSTDFIESNGLRGYRDLGDAQMQTADGRRRTVKLVKFDNLYIGPWHLKGIKAAICDRCALLAGKSVLNQFKTSSDTVKGVEYLRLTR